MIRGMRTPTWTSRRTGWPLYRLCDILFDTPIALVRCRLRAHRAREPQEHTPVTFGEADDSLWAVPARRRQMVEALMTVKNTLVGGALRHMSRVDTRTSTLQLRDWCA